MNQQNTDTQKTAKASIEGLIDRKRKNLEAIFDAVSVGLLFIDEDLTIIRVNDTIRQMTRKDYPEIINRSVGEAFGCSTITMEKKACGLGCNCQNCPLRQNIKRVFETSQPVHEFEFKSDTHFQNGQEKPWLSMNIEPVSIEDKKYAVVCLNDITDKKLAEQEILEMMEMKSQFISTVSHELRTPLTAIKEAINIVLDGLAGRVKKKQKYFLEIAKRDIERLSLLVNDVLDFQKLEAGSMKIDFASCDIADTICHAVDTMSLAAKKNKINLTVNIAPDTGQAVFDHNRIIQVLTNLLSNAVKFTRSHTAA
jgi:signal transduction histidine kinase